MCDWGLFESAYMNDQNQNERIKKLEEALEEAMRVRHFCDIEGQPDSDDPEEPYQYDKYLKKWAKVLGRKVYSKWPNPS